MTSPLVSVVVPTYNSADYIQETIESILNQTFKNFEIVIIDDGSTDNTKEIISNFDTSRIRYFYQENFGGPSKGRNVGISKSRGQLIALFDSDDVMFPDKLLKAVTILEKKNDVDFVFSDFSTITQQGVNIKRSFSTKYKNYKQILTYSPEQTFYYMDKVKAYEELIMANFIGTSSVVFRKKCIDMVGFFDESLKNADDIDMWYKMARNNVQMAFIDSPLHAYRKRENSISSHSGKRMPAVIKVLEKQLDFVVNESVHTVLERNIYNRVLGLAWSLRKTGRYSNSKKEYQKALRLKQETRAYIGYVIAFTADLFSKRKTTHKE